MIKNYSNKVMDYEYNAFMSVMNVSVSKHLFDEHFTVLWANDYFYDLIGYEKQEYETLFQNHVDEYYKDDPESVVLMMGIVTEAFQNKEEGFEFECPMHVKGGDTKWIRVTGRFTDELFEGVPVIYTIYTDITKLKEMQLALENQSRQLGDALDAAERANHAKSDFLSRMSHDIRTPMNAIVGMTNIASSHTDDPEKVQDCLRKISSSSQHLLGLINDVLDMSKIESGKMELTKEKMSLPDVVESVVTIMQPAFKEKNQHFEVRLGHVQHEDFICDSLRLRQVFINILSNAAKFTPENGQIGFEVTEAPCEMPGHALLQFSFSDSGVGVSPEFLPHIFDAFTRERDSRIDQIQGSGLGMAITKKLTELLGGSIRVESKLGEGTTFFIELPMEITDAPIYRATYEGTKILVVDDDELSCEYLVEGLKELNVSVDWAENGSDAVAKVTKAHAAGEEFDLILLDWQMPGMDGMQTARSIREVAGSNTPILIVSAYDWNEIKDKALKAGINGFLQKPLFKSVLSWGIRTYVLGEQTTYKEKKQFSFEGKRFLIVEDNALNREIAVELLTEMGASVETACDGVEGTQCFRRSPEGYYDVILMDVQMPNLNGHDATRYIRELPRKDAACIPIIAMTADAFAEDIEAAKKAGMNSHLAKPFDAISLNREIGKFL